MRRKIIVVVVVLLAVANGFAQTERGADAAAVFKESKPVVERSSNESQLDYENKRGGKRSGFMFRIFGGAAFPIGEFANKEDVNAGYAKTGWTVGAQFVTSEAVGFIVEGSYSQNNIELPSYYSAPDGKYDHTGWTSILALTGLKIGTENSSKTNFFIAPLIGALFGTYPEITFTSTITSKATTSPSSSSAALAYGAAVEMIFWERMTLDARYIASKPKFKFTENGYEAEIEQNIGLLIVSLGVAF